MNSLTVAKPKAVAAFDNPFKGLKPEVEQTERKAIEPVRNKTVEKLKQIWKEAVGWMIGSDMLKMQTQEIYQRCIDKIKKTRYCAKDVELFSVAMAEFKYAEGVEPKEWFEVKAGIFLSALVNNGKGKRYTLQVKHLGTIPFLGFRLKTGKELTIMGDCSGMLGEQLSGGIIRIFGNAGDNVGSHSIKGTIYLEGDFKTISGSCQAKVYSNGCAIKIKIGENYVNRTVINNGKQVGVLNE